MPTKQAPTLNPKQLMALLKLGNVDQQLYGAGVGPAKLMEMLQSLPPLAKDDTAGLLARLERYYPEPVLNFNECLVLSFVDDCMHEILRRASLDPKLEWLILRFTPHVALAAVAKGPARLFDSFPTFGLIDQLCDYCIGWSGDLGILGDLSIEKVEKLVEDIPYDPKLQMAQLKELKDYFQGEYQRFSDREALFTQAELKKLESGGARDQAARIINREMEGHQFGFFIIILLQGEWLDFMQSVLLEKGLKSKEWEAALKLSRMLIWSLRAHAKEDADAQKRLRNIITNLPSKVRALDRSVSLENSQAENAIADVEAEYDAILNGSPAERGDFTPIEVQGFALGDDNESSFLTENQIEAKAGEWFYYGDLDHESSRLKLILLWQNKQLLFTNHNHKSAIPIGYADFYRSLAAGKVRKLPAVPRCNKIVRNYVQQLLIEQRQKKVDAARLKQEEQETLQQQVVTAKQLVAASEINVADEINMAELPLADRKAALAREIEAVRQVEAAQEQKVEKQKQVAEQKRQDAAKVVENANAAVGGLGIGAEIKIESETGEVVECKLLTKISSINRYIFVDQNGIKVAQHSQDELTKMYLDKKLEILDRGEEFEDTLASVVRGLREDRDKIVAEEEM